LDFEEKVRGNSLATELLPQARQVVAMRETRSKFLKTQTFLGKVEAKIDDYCTANLLDPTDIDVTGSDEEILTHFSNTVATGNAEKFLRICV